MNKQLSEKEFIEKIVKDFEITFRHDLDYRINWMILREVKFLKKSLKQAIRYGEGEK